MKALYVPMEDRYHQDLEEIRQFFRNEQGVEFSKTMATKKLLHECASRIRETGSLWGCAKED